MLYTKEDLSQVIQEVQSIIEEMGYKLDQFEINAIESGPCVRVASYTDNGGFMVRLYGTNDIERMKKEILELYNGV